jgi:hypothetical protein
MDCNYKYLHLNHEKSIFHEDAHSPSAWTKYVIFLKTIMLSILEKQIKKSHYFIVTVVRCFE